MQAVFCPHDGWLRAAVLAIVVLACCRADAKNPAEWNSATVVYSHVKVANDTNVAARSGLIQTAHEVLDLDAGAVTYTVEQWVVPWQALRLAEGCHVGFYVIGKSIVLRLNDGKTRKLKIVSTIEKRPH